MKESVKNDADFIDYSYIYEKINFFDNVHVDQGSKEKIADLMKKDILKIIKDKCD